MLVLDCYLYLSWTFCLMSTRFSAEMSRSRYSDSVSVAVSKSFWLACNKPNKQWIHSSNKPKQYTVGARIPNSCSVLVPTIWKPTFKMAALAKVVLLYTVYLVRYLNGQTDHLISPAIRIPDKKRYSFQMPLKFRSKVWFSRNCLKSGPKLHK